mgnify:CR=1
MYGFEVTSRSFSTLPCRVTRILMVMSIQHQHHKWASHLPPKTSNLPSTPTFTLSTSTLLVSKPKFRLLPTFCYFLFPSRFISNHQSNKDLKFNLFDNSNRCNSFDPITLTHLNNRIFFEIFGVFMLIPSYIESQKLIIIWPMHFLLSLTFRDIIIPTCIHP